MWTLLVVLLSLQGNAVSTSSTRAYPSQVACTNAGKQITRLEAAGPNSAPKMDVGFICVPEPTR